MTFYIHTVINVNQQMTQLQKVFIGLSLCLTIKFQLFLAIRTYLSHPGKFLLCKSLCSQRLPYHFSDKKLVT
jgi:hypothetical protein